MIGAWVVAARNAAMPVRPIMMAISSLPGSHSLLKQANSMPIAADKQRRGKDPPARRSAAGQHRQQFADKYAHQQRTGRRQQQIALHYAVAVAPYCRGDER